MVEQGTAASELEELERLVNTWAEASARLTAPGAAFATVEELVDGERMAVFRDRPGSLRDVLQAAAAHGDRDCVIFGDGARLGFSEFAEQVAAIAAGLAERGVTKGDRVAICAANGPGWLLSLWAATSMGAVVVAMNGWWTQLEMQNALDLTEPVLLLGDTNRLERLGSTTIPTLNLDLDTEFRSLLRRDASPALPEVPLHEDDPGTLLFTSGTTGRPKAAVLTHRSIIAFVMMQSFIGARAAALANRPTDGAPRTRLAVFPLFHVSGLAASVAGMLTGSTTVWPLGRFDAAHVIELTKRHGISAWGGTTTHVRRLLDDPALDTLDPSTIHQVGIGGSASTPQLIRRTEERFPHLKGTFSSGYGSTESGGLISFASNRMLQLAPDCVGPPLPTIEVRILDDAGQSAAPGVDGDVCVRSALLMREYWRHPDANAESFRPGRWLKTGDIGRLEAGALFLSSRKRDLIIRGGENIYPFEIENRIEEHPDVVETAVIGVDHDTLGQEVKAVVVVAPGSRLTEDAIRSMCTETLASYKVPAHVELRTAPLPRNATGKIMKHVLDDQAENPFVDE